MEIPREIREKLNVYSERFGIKVSDLEKEMLEYYPEISEKHPKMSNERKMYLCLRKLRLQLMREEGGIRSRAVMFTGFFLGADRIRNTAEQMIAKIKRMPKEEQAKYHPEPEVWLDYREGSKTYLKPIEGRDFRTYYFIGSTGREIDLSRLKAGRLTVWRDQVRTLVPKLGVTYNFRAIIRDSDQQLPYYDTDASSVTRFREAMEQLSMEEKEDLLRRAVEVIKLDEVELAASVSSGNGFPVFVEGDVTRIVFREDKQNIVTLTDEAANKFYRLVTYFPDYLPIDFAEDDRIVVLGDFGTVEFPKDGKTTVLYAKGYLPVRELPPDEEEITIE